MFIHWDAASVIYYSTSSVWENSDLDGRTVPGHRFIDGIIYNFIDQVVKPGRACRADIHTWAFTNGF